jgi:hypothetical protein
MLSDIVPHSFDQAFYEVAELDRADAALRRLLSPCYARILSLLWSCSGGTDTQGDSLAQAIGIQEFLATRRGKGEAILPVFSLLAGNQRP